VAQFLLLSVLASMLLELESDTEIRTWLSRRMGLALLRRGPTPHHALYREPCERAPSLRGPPLHGPPHRPP
jgi:hypothetical protein